MSRSAVGPSRRGRSSVLGRLFAGGCRKFPRELRSLCIPCSPAVSLTFIGSPAAGLPEACLPPPPCRWGLHRLPFPPEPAPPLSAAARTGAPLCQIRVEPLPSLKSEPRALAALWQRSIKRGFPGPLGAQARGAGSP